MRTMSNSIAPRHRGNRNQFVICILYFLPSTDEAVDLLKLIAEHLSISFGFMISRGRLVSIHAPLELLWTVIDI